MTQSPQGLATLPEQAQAPAPSGLRRSLAAVKRGWLKFAHVLAWINTRILLGAVFLVFFVPVGLVLAVLRRDLIGQRVDPKAATYWVERSAEDRQRPPEDYERQY